MITVTPRSSKRTVCGSLAILLGVVLPAINAGSAVIDVRQCGALGDGKTLDTAAIQKAIDQCGAAGGGIVHFPPGIYLCQPISLWNKTTLELDAGAQLLATDDPADFTRTNKPTVNQSGSFTAFISGSDLTDIAITGKGTIDGAGARWWGPAAQVRKNDKNATLPRPRTIVLSGCKNVKISGVTLQNSPSFHLAPVDCQNLLIEGVTFKAPTNSPNTDGINLSQCRNVTINRCTIDVGGENLVIKSSRPMPGREFATDDITVTGCTFRHGRGLSVGSETMGGVRNVTVKDCTFEGTENGLHIKSSRNKGAIAENIDCENLSLKDVKDAIVISCYNQGIPQTDTGQPIGEWTPIFRNIHFKNMTASCYHSIGLIVGLPESEIKNVSLENVKISSSGTGLRVRNAKGIQLKNVHLWPKQGDPIIAEDNAQIQDMDKVRTAAN
jgi:polygalacturonase